MTKRSKSRVLKLKKPIKGMSTETFVRGYKGQSQMNTDMINKMKLSSRGSKIMQSVYEALGKE